MQEGSKSRQLRGRNNKAPVLKALVKDLITGFTTLVNTQEEIIAVAAKSNLCHQSQTKRTAFRLNLLNACTFLANNKENYNTVISSNFIPSKEANLFAKEFRLVALE